MTALELANALIENDFNDDCPFCKKYSWNVEDHEATCPFAMAYKIVEENKL
jgi:hypothetical protein